MKTRLDLFDSKKGLDRGRPKIVEALWYLVKIVFFLTAIPWPHGLKTFWLRLFGAEIGIGVVIKPRVNLLFPWKLTIGDHVWIGEEVSLLNFEPLTLGNHTCLSQRVFLCGGNHDFRDPAMPYRNGPITLESGVWIGAQSFVGPGVTIGEESVITVGSVVTQPLPAGQICSGNPCLPRKPRWNQTL